MSSDVRLSMRQRLDEPSQREELIRAYLRDGLDEHATEAFELCLMDDPVLLDEVELETKLQAAMGDGATRPKPHLAVSTSTPRHIGMRKPVWLALAAGLAVGVIIGPAMLQLVATDGRTRVQAPELLVLPARRGAADPEPPLTMKIAAQTPLLLQWPAPLMPLPLRARVVDGDGERFVALVPAADAGTVSLLVQARGNASGMQIWLECDRNGEWRPCGRAVELH